MPQLAPVLAPPPEKMHLSKIDSSKNGASEVSVCRASHSEFSLLLTNIAVLYVGEDRTTYYVHEDALCKLPFFRAALQGQFKEAVEKKITMPEDDPEAVSALIQWLYTERYTYEGNKLQETTLEIRAAPKEPSANLLEGLFHLEVYIVASKYDCKSLLAAAKKMLYEAQDKMDAIDMFRLYKAETTAHNPSLLLPFVQPKPPSLLQYSQRVRKWVDKLFGEHHEEVQRAILQFPQLGLDLLQMCTIDSSTVHEEGVGHMRG